MGVQLIGNRERKGGTTHNQDLQWTAEKGRRNK